MKTKTLKSFRTLANDLKSRRKPNLTQNQVDKANKVFEEIEKEQTPTTPNRKIAQQPEA